LSCCMSLGTNGIEEYQEKKERKTFVWKYESVCKCESCMKV